MSRRAPARRYARRRPARSPGPFDAASRRDGARARRPRGVGFRSLAESIDTTSATGRLVLHLFAALADFERELISERTKASLAAKRRRGEAIGRPRALSPSQVAEVRRMIERGESPTHIARLFRCGRATLYRALA